MLQWFTRPRSDRRRGRDTHALEVHVQVQVHVHGGRTFFLDVVVKAADLCCAV